VPVVTVLYSGRPVAVNDLLNRSDAFVAAWLPGTEALGMTDVLLAAANGALAHDFTAKLPFDWPASDCLPQHAGVQFARGYGLSYKRSRQFGRLPEPGRVGACPADSR
jgi:beta-glucosidase